MDKNKIVMIAPVALAGILMLAVLAAISSTNQASAAEKKTELTISATQTGPAKTEENNETHGAGLTKVPVKFSGRLTSEGSGVAGASIMIGSGEEEIETTDTDSGGHYSVATELAPSEYTILAHTVKIPSGYEKAEATTTIHLR